jgi:signal transduction histidine kinase
LTTGRWRLRWPRVWDAYFAAVHGFVLASLVVARDVGPGRRLAAATAVVGIAVLYAVLGRRLVRAGATGWPAAGYLAATLALFVAGLAATGDVGILLFAISPLVFQTLPLKPAVGVVVLANLLPSVVAVARDGQVTRVVTHLGPMALVSTALAVWLGTWFDHVVRQSEERAALIAELEHSRAEAARLSREAGVAAERTRLAGEIHDTLAQGFTSIITLLQAAESELESDRHRARDRLALAVRTARENLAESRALVAALTPSALGTGSLEQAVRRQADRLGEENGLAVDVRTVGVPRPLPTATEVVLLRAAQEALTNVRRHAGAGRVDVRLSYADDRVRLVVTDDGRGFDPDRPTAGYGLPGMRARAGQVGGTVTVRSAPGRGSTVELEVAT